MEILGAGFQGCRADVEIVVQSIRHGNFLQRSSAGSLRGPDVDAFDVADVAIKDELDAALEDFLAALLGAVLENAFMLGAGFHQRAVLIERVAERLFDINILAGSHRRQRDRHVPVVGRGDDHRVNGFVGEQFAEVVVELRIVALDFLHHLAGGLAALAEWIGDGDRLGTGHGEESLPRAGALSADADVAEAIDFCNYYADEFWSKPEP